MQVVERGLIGLDDDVRETLPQLKELKVITGFEDPSTENPSGRPILEDVKGPLTLRSVYPVQLRPSPESMAVAF